MQVSENIFPILREFEGFSEKAYLDSAGVWTIGYGTTRINGHPVKFGDKISREAAELIMREQLQEHLDAVVKHIKVELTQNQIDAIASFVYNIGAGAFAKSTFLKKLNAEDFDGAASEFKKWNKDNGKVLAGLTKRREAEKELFLS